MLLAGYIQLQGCYQRLHREIAAIDIQIKPLIQMLMRMCTSQHIWRNCKYHNTRIYQRKISRITCAVIPPNVSSLTHLTCHCLKHVTVPHQNIRKRHHPETSDTAIVLLSIQPRSHLFFGQFVYFLFVLGYPTPSPPRDMPKPRYLPTLACSRLVNPTHINTKFRRYCTLGKRCQKEG